MIAWGEIVKTDVDTCLKEIADWYVEHRREITLPELNPILEKHCESEAEIKKFTQFLATEPGQLRFKTLLRERKEASGSHGLTYPSPPGREEVIEENLTPLAIKEGKHPYHPPEGIPAEVYPVRASTGEGYSLFDTTQGVWFGQRRGTYEEAVTAADKENRRLWDASAWRRKQR